MYVGLGTKLTQGHISVAEPDSYIKRESGFSRILSCCCTVSKSDPLSGPAEPVRLLRSWPDQFLRLSKIFRAATCSCRLEICVLVACKLSAGDARLM